MEYLISNSEDCAKAGVCPKIACSHVAKQRPDTGRWYITMGHAGFNSRENNGSGYATQLEARQASTAFGLKGMLTLGGLR